MSTDALSRRDPGFTSRGLVLRGYDVSRDGQRFLMIKGADEADARTDVHIALQWSPTR